MNPKSSNLVMWKKYLRLQQRLSQSEPIGDSIKPLTPEQIERLSEGDIQTLQATGILPTSDDLPISFQRVRAIRSYLRLMPKPNLPTLLQTFSEDEIRNLDADDLQALHHLNLLPDRLLQETTLPPSSSEPIPNPPIPMPEYDYAAYPFHGYHNDPILAMERAGQLYDEAARNFRRSIERQSDVMGRAFRKAGG